MFQTCTSLITASVLLLHALLGCCWHMPCDGAHVRCCAEPVAADDDALEHHHESSGCRHDHPADLGSRSVAMPACTGDSPSEQELPNSCQHGECSYLAAETPSLDCGDMRASPLESGALSLQIAGLLTVATQLADCRTAKELGGPLMPDLDAARSRARLQLWLV
ncbi:MAG: hypothetical protein ACK5Q5_03335 [Planctomycetaceae bacterium]